MIDSKVINTNKGWKKTFEYPKNIKVGWGYSTTNHNYEWEYVLPNHPAKEHTWKLLKDLPKDKITLMEYGWGKPFQPRKYELANKSNVKSDKKWGLVEWGKKSNNNTRKNKESITNQTKPAVQAKPEETKPNYKLNHAATKSNKEQLHSKPIVGKN